MGEVIEVKFGTEREWQQTRRRIHEGMRTIGELFGDSAELMDAKADVVYQLLREIVDDMPTINFNAPLPDELSDAGVEHIREQLKRAVLAGVQVAMTHAVGSTMRSIYDLCTSKLSRK